jgi:acyl-coenzyme A synthetase/AMP-(fatty) acid ligase
LISIKNSREGTRHLLTESKSTHLIVDENFVNYSTSLELSIACVLFEDIPTSGNEGDIETFNIDELTEEERVVEINNPSYYLHTSGSTGHPKLVRQV